MSDIFMQGTEQMVLALPVFIKRGYLKLQFVEVGDKLRNQLVIPLLKMFDVNDEICGPDMSWELTLL